MRRSVAIVWHAVAVILAAGLYFFFVLPRWPELAGSHISHPVGTALRIVTGVVLASTAVPVLLVLRHTRRPEFGTPQLALNLRIWSIVGAVLAGVMIIATAVAEIWLNLDKAGVWLFGSYGAAAAIGLLSAIAFHLAYVAELPPAPPKPIKAKKPPARPEAAEQPAAAEETVAAPEEPAAAEEPVATETDEPDDTGKPAPDPGRRRGLRNRRPAGKSA